MEEKIKWKRKIVATSGEGEQKGSAAAGKSIGGGGYRGGDNGLVKGACFWGGDV